ncbi:hypothetical protein HN865_04320 [Candidatus Woesearchaeota archaeon]|jgi:hypothetical protein|nr:hypothetical protein [Candidatus Woesearchaeota archaeon]MBT7238053.1 hypothetical protein [Candidatus Woesearchaeota archaeon]
MSKFAIKNYFDWILSELSKKNKFTWPNMFKKSWIFLLLLLSALLFLRLLLNTFIWLVFILIGIEFFNWLAGKHE